MFCIKRFSRTAGRRDSHADLFFARLASSLLLLRDALASLFPILLPVLVRQGNPAGPRPRSKTWPPQRASLDALRARWALVSERPEGVKAGTAPWSAFPGPGNNAVLVSHGTRLGTTGGLHMTRQREYRAIHRVGLLRARYAAWTDHRENLLLPIMKPLDSVQRDGLPQPRSYK